MFSVWVVLCWSIDSYLIVFGLGWISVSCLATHPHHPRLADHHNYGACRITEESLGPLHAKPSEVDEAIAVQVAKINATKATIISNDGKIQRLTETLVVR